MSDNDMIRRGDARNAVIQSTGAMDAVANINAIPADDRAAKLVEAAKVAEEQAEWVPIKQGDMSKAILAMKEADQ